MPPCASACRCQWIRGCPRTASSGFGGSTGLGFRPGNAAVGWDAYTNPTSALETMQHELGHNFSLMHTDCGGPAGPDPDFPYAGALMGNATLALAAWNLNRRAGA